MQLNMTMHQERSGVHNMVPDSKPRRPRRRQRRRERISILGVVKIEGTRNFLHCLGDGGVVECAVAPAEDEVFVRVFVDWVRGLAAAVDLHDEVDPGVVLCADDEVVGYGGLVEEEGLGFFEFEVEAAVS